MKKIILTLGIAALSLTGFAQLNAEGDGFTNNYTLGSSNCLANSAPNNGGIMNGDNGTLTAATGVNSLQATGLVLTSILEIPDGATPAWFPMQVTVGDACFTLFGNDQSINMSSNPRIKVRAKANVANATLEFFLGGEGQWSPSTSTFASEIIASYTFETADTEVEFTIDFEDIDATKWGNFTGKSTIQSIGYRSATADAVFTVVEVQFGSLVPAVGLFGSMDVTTFEVYPNPVSEVVNLGEAAINAVLYNAQGIPVFSAAKAEKIEVGTLGLEPGVYLLQAENGRAKIVVE